MTTMAMFSAKPYDRRSFDATNGDGSNGPALQIRYHESRLDRATATYAVDADVVCAFVNDDLSADVLEVLAASGTRCIALRCSGFNNIDLEAAERLELSVVRVPSYSPNAVADAPHNLAATIDLPAGRESATMRALLAEFPSTSVVEVKGVIGQVRTIVTQMATAITAATAVAVLAGIAVLIGAIAAARDVRMYDAIVLRTLGATRALVGANQLQRYRVRIDVIAIDGHGRLVRRRDVLAGGTIGA